MAQVIDFHMRQKDGQTQTSPFYKQMEGILDDIDKRRVLFGELFVIAEDIMHQAGFTPEEFQVNRASAQEFFIKEPGKDGELGFFFQKVELPRGGMTCFAVFGSLNALEGEGNAEIYRTKSFYRPRWEVLDPADRKWKEFPLKNRELFPVREILEEWSTK